MDLAAENGVVLLTLPPHCAHYLQPLDRTVFGALKKFIHSFSHIWITDNPGKTIKIHDLSGVVDDLYMIGLTRPNIISGFRSTGIYPFNRDVFTDIDFMLSYVTDQSGLSRFADEAEPKKILINQKKYLFRSKRD